MAADLDPVGVRPTRLARSMIEVASQSTRWAISSRISSSPDAEAVSGRSFVPGGLTCIDVSNWWSSSSVCWLCAVMWGSRR